MTRFNTLNEALVAHRDSPRAIHYLEGEHNERALTMRELHDRAVGLLHHFQACGATPGSEMILLLDSNPQFVDTFWACLLGGIVAVPLATGANDEHQWKFLHILRQLQQPHLCTDARIFSRLTTFAAANGCTAELDRLRAQIVFLDQLEDVSRPGKLHAPRPNDLAFVQYSSGSTSEPKGVALTHRNLLVNIEAIAHGIGLGREDAGLSWMPLTHDMGLIGFHLTPLVMDVTHYLMPAQLFVRRPHLWLSKASEKRATVLCSPNFGYQHVLKTCHPEQFSQLDLAPVRILFNGAEPISVELCEKFLATLAPSGLQSTAMFPVYGLAEASLAVTFPPPGIHYRTATVSRHALNVGATVEATDAINTDAVTFVGVGHPVAGCAVRIADENGQPLPAQTVGRILIRGDNVTHGYYRNAAATQEAVSAEGWLDTGDLGFLGNDGLVVTGRLKDILFINGQNYYPQDIENVLVKHAGVELGKIAVCGVRAPGREADTVLVFVLHRSALDDFVPIAKNIRKCVNEKIGIAVGQVIPVDRIPKTTSGKIRRYLLAQQYQVGAFAPIIAQLQAFGVQDPSAASEQQNEIERTLREICNTFITDKTVGLHDNIFELGTNSLTLAQIHQRIEATYPDKLQITDFFDYPTIADLAKYLEQRTAVQA